MDDSFLTKFSLFKGLTIKISPGWYFKFDLNFKFNVVFSWSKGVN